MFPDILKNNILDTLKEYSGSEHLVESIRTVGGGSINNAIQLKTNIDNYFIKWNLAGSFPEMFKKEILGIHLLADTAEISVPEIILTNNTGNYSYLILKYQEPAIQKQSFWVDFGRSLAKLHRHNDVMFGLDHDNYIGSLYQSNKKHHDWISFFIEERVDMQLRLTINEKKIEYSLIKNFENLYRFLPEIFPVENSALLHGDLWSGTYIINAAGDACIIDPAVYYGFREMDIAMSKLFGGFSQEFYFSYNEEYPMEKGWNERIDICNLYPLLVHVNLFGEGYIDSVKSIVKRF